MKQSTSNPQEVLLLLSGQLNSLSISSSSSFSSFSLSSEPSTSQSIQSIRSIANLHQSIIDFISINSNSKNHNSLGLASLGSALNRELIQYQSILSDLEFKLLSHHPTLIPYDSNSLPSPPLSAILAELNPWHSIFYALNQLLNQLQLNPSSNHHHHHCSTPKLIQLLFQHSRTGDPHLSQIFNRIQISIEHLWIDAFRSFVIYGQRPKELLSASTDFNHQDRELIDDLFIAQRARPPGTTTDQIKHQPLIYLLKPNALPHLPSLNPYSGILHSISQITLSLSILSHLHQLKSNRSRSTRLSTPKLILPTQLQSQLSNTLSKVDHLSHPAFRHTIESVQDILSAHLFTTYLTPDILLTTLRSLADVFLFQHPSFTTNLVNGFSKLRLTRLLSSVHRQRRSITLSERELDVILLKAAVSTDTDPRSQPINLTGFGFTLFSISSNSLHDLHPSSPEAISTRFSTLWLDDQFPMLLTFTPTPDLSLFLTKESCTTYSLIHSCLFSFLIVRDRLKECWITLGRRERDRRRWGKELDSESSNGGLLSRICWETRRLMSWWIEEMISHLWTNVINLNLTKLIHQLNHIQSSLNFNSLSILHAHFLFKLSFGLCLFEMGLLKSLLMKCLKLCDELDRSESDLFPPLLFHSDHHHPENQTEQEEEGKDRQFQNRLKRVNELGIEFKSELKEFFESLSRINHQPEKPVGGGGGGSGVSQTIEQSSTMMMGAIGASIPGWLESLGDGDETDEVLRESRTDVLVFKRTVVSQLLSKLDFSGFFSEPEPKLGEFDDCERVLDGL